MALDSCGDEAGMRVRVRGFGGIQQPHTTTRTDRGLNINPPDPKAFFLTNVKGRGCPGAGPKASKQESNVVRGGKGSLLGAVWEKNLCSPHGVTPTDVNSVCCQAGLVMDILRNLK